MNLPVFKYHPDPIATGVIIESDSRCRCCAQSRGYLYVGPVYAEDDYDDCICPWCIADGSASKKFLASFTDIDGIGADGDCPVSSAVADEVANRTPGFNGWQQESWWTHCGDAAQFIGHAGHDDLVRLGPDVVQAIRRSSGLDDAEWPAFFRSLRKDGSPTAYLFRCAKCQAIGGYQDCD